MSRPVCQHGCVMFDNVCYCRCPSGSSPANEDPTKCVPDFPTCSEYAVSAGFSSGALVSDPTFTLSCIKVRRPVEQSGLCLSGYTEWQSGSCYVNCPSGLVENGLTCLKRPLQRSYKYPTCENSLYYFSGTDCYLSFNGVLFGIIIFVVVWYVCIRILSFKNK